MPTFAAATGAVAVVGLLLAVGQALAVAAVAPGPAGVLRLALVMLPTVLGVALPVGVLFGGVSAARAWREGGDWQALASAGVGARATAGPMVAAGLAVALLGGLLTHGLEPLARRDARRTLAVAAGDLRLQPGRPLAVGETLVLAGTVRERDLGEVLVATGSTVVAARQGELQGEGRVGLSDGQAVQVRNEGGAGWTLHFARAELRLDVQAPRVELAERTDAELSALAGRLEGEGQPATAQRLALARRTALPACVPLLALLAVPLGARGATPGAAATATVLGWWAVLRVSDQAATTWGHLPAAWAPAAALVLAAGLAWATWRSA